jgi:hypothetical protein
MGGIPNSATTIQRPDLAQLAYEYMMDAASMGYIGARLFPFFGVAEKSADYPYLPMEAFLKVVDDLRGQDGTYNEDDYEWGTKTYSCKDRGRVETVEDSEKALYRRYFDLSEVAMMRALTGMLLNHEIRCSAKISTSNLSNSAIAAAWSTASTAAPLTAIKTGKRAMRAASGLLPNVVAMNWTTWDYLTATDEILDAFQYTGMFQTMSIQQKRQMMAAYFEVDDVLISGAIKDSAKKGQSKSIADVWTTGYVLLARVPGEDMNNMGAMGSPGNLKSPVLGRTFLWEADSPVPFVVEEKYDWDRRKMKTRVRTNMIEEFQFAGAGYLLTGADS